MSDVITATGKDYKEVKPRWWKRPYCILTGHNKQLGIMHALMLDFRSKWYGWEYCKRCGKITVPQYEMNPFTKGVL